MSVRFRRNAHYSVVFDLPRDPLTGKRKQKRISGFRKEKEAEAYLNRVLTQVQDGGFADPGKLTVGEYLPHWLDTHKDGLRPSTYRHYKSIVELHLVPGLGHVRLKELQPLLIQRFLTSELRNGRKDNKKTVGKGLSPAAVQYEYRVLRTALAHAVELELLNRNPAVNVRPPRAEKATELAVLDEKQVKALLAALEGSQLYLPTFLAVHTGMRLGEILGLPWRDVDLENQVIHVRRASVQRNSAKPEFAPPKTPNSRRNIDITQTVVQVLKAHRVMQKKWRIAAGPGWQDFGLVCCHEDGLPLNPPSMSSRFRQLTQKLGLPVHFHQLRHTHASMLIKLGKDAKTISVRLGHSSVSFTLDVYGHLFPGMQREAAEAVEKLLGENGS